MAKTAPWGSARTANWPMFGISVLGTIVWAPIFCAFSTVPSTLSTPR